MDPLGQEDHKHQALVLALEARVPVDLVLVLACLVHPGLLRLELDNAPSKHNVVAMRAHNHAAVQDWAGFLPDNRRPAAPKYLELQAQRILVHSLRQTAPKRAVHGQGGPPDQRVQPVCLGPLRLVQTRGPL